jgi:heme-degrading monooxygenase HmoA
MSDFAKTPEPPYYAVIFTSLKIQDDLGYKDMAEEMLNILEDFDGFLGAESFRGEDGFGVTISFWESLEALNLWKSDPKHKEAQKLGREIWYKKYKIRIAKVERDYSFGEN